MLKLYNTLTRTKEDFRPINGSTVGLYTCGPTVYNYAHIGNLRTYIFEDILKRTLRYNDFHVNHVMNITDVGHLTDDADNGEDKMERGAAREGKTAWEIADFYTTAFKNDLHDLNIIEPDIWCKATDHIAEQIALVETLKTKGVTYETSDGIYFDTTKINDYGKLAQLDKQQLKAGARVDMGEKKHPSDFALWKFSGAEEHRQMEWEAFGRMGFPGWHIECSAMSMKYLSDHFDIHCGGIDHVPVHHTNEIAQSETATGVIPWVNFWLHGEFLTIDEARMGKSVGNFVTLQTIKDKGYSPLAYRYFLLQAHYRKQIDFSWQAIEAAENGLAHLRQLVKNIDPHQAMPSSDKRDFLDALNDDLNVPAALAYVWSVLKAGQVSLRTIIQFDKVFGLDLHNPNEQPVIIPNEVTELGKAREEARLTQNWAESDRLRDKITALGFKVEDTKDGQKIS